MIETPRKVLVFAAHQDDETIGCGATLKKWSLQGSKVKVVFMTNGSPNPIKNQPPREITKGAHNPFLRMKEAHLATKLLGVNDVETFLDSSTQCLRNDQLMLHRVIKIIRGFQPDLVLTHCDIDKHRDHKSAFNIVKEACWKAQEDLHPELGSQWRVSDIWAFEVSDLLPEVDFVVDVTETFKFKKEAYRKYISQHKLLSSMHDHIDGLSKVRGSMIGKGKRGEAFTRLSCSPIIIS